MKSCLLVFAVLLATSPAATAQEADAATVEKIMTLLSDMKCQMDPDDIEVTAAGYGLDDVICEGGQQYDIDLDKDLAETGRRAE